MRPCRKNHFQCLTGPGPTLILAASGVTALVSAVVSPLPHVHRLAEALAVASHATCVFTTTVTLQVTLLLIQV